MERIGAGGMGQVYQARHRRLDRIVAVKLLSPAMMKDPSAVARFEREVQAAAKLRHPNIVAVDDADCVSSVQDNPPIHLVVRREIVLLLDINFDYGSGAVRVRQREVTRH